MTTSSSAPSFSHEERIAIYPFKNSATVRLEATSSLLQPHENHTTPFPRIIQQIVADYSVSRILFQTGSISSVFHDSVNPLDDEFSNGPSGVSVLVEMKDADRFPSLLRALVGYRLILAPLEAIHLTRLHRHVYKTTLADGNKQLQIVLPLEGSAVASEGVKEFLAIASPCPRDGILSSENAKALSHVLLGDSSGIAVSYQKRRTMWMDIQSRCSSCEITVRRGLQYASILREDVMSEVSLSQLVPMSSFKKCPVSNKSQLITIANVQQKELAETRFLETAIDDWSFDSVLDLSAEQAAPNTQFYGDRTLLRPQGVANLGRLVTQIATNGIQCPTTVYVTEILPPYILPLWDTWTLETRPLLTRQSDGTIVVEWTATLLTDTTFQVMLDYEPVLLPFQQFPADPNRGIELPPTIFVFEPECALISPVKLYSSPLLLMPPVQDMSMPFNVISLTCTLYAFVIGSLANLLVRKSSEKVKRTLSPETKKTKLQKLKERLREKIRFWQRSECISSKAQEKGAGETKQTSLSNPGDEAAQIATALEAKVNTAE